MRLQLHRLVAVSDAGIGGHAIVAEIHKAFPIRDIPCFADRASFPYGGKGRDELLSAMRRSLAFLSRFEPDAIVIAANAPSIMVLEELQREPGPPLFGVHPPLEKALSRTRTGHVGILGVRSPVESPMPCDFAARRTAHPGRVARIDASPMVELVGSGAFRFDPAATQQRVEAFMREVRGRLPGSGGGGRRRAVARKGWQRADSRAGHRERALRHRPVPGHAGQGGRGDPAGSSGRRLTATAISVRSRAIRA